MTLRFRATPDQESRLIEMAKSIKDGHFRGDDDLRDAIHNLVYERTCPNEAGDLLLDTFHDIETGQSETVEDEQLSTEPEI